MQGFTLTELLVVMLITGILASQVVIGLTSSNMKVKGAAFNMRSDMQLAKSESISRDVAVRIDFILGAIDGYRLWIDDNPAGGDSTYTAGSDTLIKEVFFDDRIQFYAPIPGGPTVSPSGTPLGGTGVNLSFGNTWFAMLSDGSANYGGNVVLYGPGNEPGEMLAKPYAMVIFAATGRVRLERWRPEEGGWATR